MAPPPPPRGWWARHWKAAIFGGCLTLIVLFCAFLAGIFLLVFSSFRSSDVYRMALERARANPDVVRQLGTPIEPGWWVSGSMNVTGGSGSADLAIPIHGPKGTGKIELVARKRDGRWMFRRLVVLPDGGAPIVVEESDQPEENQPGPKQHDF